ncbi:MAG: class I SAM-dependent methyltransferase [Patescibacteria group bacterium]
MLKQTLFDLNKVFDKDYYQYLQQGRDDKSDTDFIIKTLNLTKEDAILDIGMGNGRILQQLFNKGFKNLTGIEQSRELYLQALQYRGLEEVDLVNDDFLEHDFKNQFDKIFFFFTGFGYYDDLTNKRIIQKIASLLKSNGLFLLDLTGQGSIRRMLNYKQEISRGGLIIKPIAQYNKRKKVFSMVYPAFNKKGQKVKEYVFKYRVYTPEEIKLILVKFGLKITAQYGNYMSGEMSEESPRNIYIAKKI